MTLRPFLLTALAAGSLLIVGLAGAESRDSRFTEADTNGDGIVTAEEYALASPRFQRLDTDGNGIVDTAEIEAMRDRARLGMASFAARRADADRDGAVTESEWQAWIDELDADGDGVVTREELRPPRGEGRHGHRGRFGARRGGPRLDGPDGDGPSEHRFGPRHGPRHRGPGGGDGPGLFDEDESGDVTTDEIESIFAELDGDGDGVLSEDELAEHRPERGRRGPRG